MANNALSYSSLDILLSINVASSRKMLFLIVYNILSWVSITNDLGEMSQHCHGHVICINHLLTLIIFNWIDDVLLLLNLEGSKEEVM